jgi:hypothetical protein
LQNAFQPRTRESRLLLRNVRFNLLAFEHEGHKDALPRPALVGRALVRRKTRQSIAPVD